MSWLPPPHNLHPHPPLPRSPLSSFLSLIPLLTSFPFSPIAHSHSFDPSLLPSSFCHLSITPFSPAFLLLHISSSHLLHILLSASIVYSLDPLLLSSPFCSLSITLFLTLFLFHFFLPHKSSSHSHSHRTLSSFFPIPIFHVYTFSSPPLQFRLL